MHFRAGGKDIGHSNTSGTSLDGHKGARGHVCIFLIPTSIFARYRFHAEIVRASQCARIFRFGEVMTAS